MKFFQHEGANLLIKHDDIPLVLREDYAGTCYHTYIGPVFTDKYGRVYKVRRIVKGGDSYSIKVGRRVWFPRFRKWFVGGYFPVPFAYAIYD